jgi:hypothetical protein
VNALRAMGSEVLAALRELRRARREAALHEPRPPVEGLVLEIGAGQAPHPRADVVVDKYVSDDFERPGGAVLDFSKPLVVADAHTLPFADDSFSYVLAIHVLEHATDPARFAAELARVAPAGFVQVPSSLAELTFGWPFHPWLIDRDGSGLVFRPRDGLRAPRGEFFHDSFAESPLLRNWWAANRSRFHHSLEWRGRLPVHVEGVSTADETARFDLERTVARLEELDRRDGLAPLPPEVRGRLRCPACRGDLEREAGEASCSGCGRSYPVVGSVPILVEEAAS